MVNAVLPQTQAETSPGFALPQDVSRGLGAIFVLLAGWLALALTAFMLLPSGNVAERNIGDVASIYFGHAAKNGLPLVMLAGAVVYIGSAIKRRGTDGPLINPTALAKEAGFALLGLLVFALMIFAYSTLKVRIPAILPFAWDEAFADWDRALFLGHDPWTLVTFLYGFPKIVSGLETLYSVWAGFLAGSFLICFAMAARGQPTALRLPLALMLAWLIGGNILALALSSAGPCYYGLVVGGPDPFAAQMAQLQALPSGTVDATLDYQSMLWAVHAGDGFGLGGISAMPSMHCTTSLLFVCAFWHRKIWRVVAILFALVIWISSVLLAWHYALDGVLALPVAIGCWWLAGHFLQKAART